MAVKRSYDRDRIDLYKYKNGEWVEMSLAEAATFNMNEVAKCIADKNYKGDFLVPVPMEERSLAGKILYGKKDTEE